MEYHSGGSLPLLGRPRYCPGAKANGGYLCETGHCCGETGCCTYYYELWWFWLLWTVLILFSCCCAYRHRRAKLRVQQQQRRQRETSLLAYHGAGSYPSSMLDLSFLASLKLPSYEEVAAQPSTPPPPYSTVFTTPRYPQPPRTSEPHLLTQHDGPLLHRRLSDGPSSFSSDNSSSCSCDSCCPSSLCSSSMSANITYETDTSHATTPGEATPLALDMKVENVAAAMCPEIKERCFDPERRSDPPDVSHQEASSDPLLTGSSAVCEVSPPPTSSSLILHQDPPAVPQLVQACSPNTASSPRVVHEDLAEGPTKIPAGIVTSLSGASSPTSPLTLDLSRTLYACSVSPGPVSVALPSSGRALALGAGSTRHPPSEQCPSLDAATLSLGQVAVLEDPGLEMVHVPTTTNLPPEETPSNTVQDSDPGLPSTGLFSEPLTQDPEPVGPNGSGVPNTQASVDRSVKAAPDLGSESVVVHEPPHPGHHAGPAPSKSGHLLVLSPSSSMGPPPANVQSGCESGPECGSFPVLDSGSTSVPVLQSSPAITIQTDPSVVPSPPAAPSPPSPPAITSTSLPATILLLDPLSVPHQASKGASPSGHTSSLSPSPRATQSPPKQTLFSPCVDVFEPEPLSWEDGEEEPEEEENEEDEEDVGADESQYRHRRLTGDSGIEVCRCRVDGEGEGEELERKERNRRGVHGERDKRGSGDTPLHDSVDCPARSRAVGHTSTSPPTSEGSGKAVIATETV